ncbi:hypothetical protein GCM10010393_08700 [Streptomyces gobitricini]|uniref:Uncharacterized protein n=1 Tax=Streptomyces gobitricini TaxID=68211 RepID=A0ABN3LAA6_9ACTN
MARLIDRDVRIAPAACDNLWRDRDDPDVSGVRAVRGPGDGDRHEGEIPHHPDSAMGHALSRAPRPRPSMRAHADIS